MPVSKMLISPGIHDQLGQDGVTEVAASLWPVDCQTCGQPLGGQPPALCVDDMMAFAYASLHHKHCRTPAWNDQGPVIASGSSQPTLTHRTRLFMFPLLDSHGAAGLLPAMIVNPAMESVFLERDLTGRWRPQPARTFAAAGLVPPGPGLRLHTPIDGAWGQFTAGIVTITMVNPPHEVYECALAPQDGPFRRLIIQEGGIMLAIFQAVDPHSADLPAQVQQALSHGHVLCGWVALRGHRR